MRTKADDAVVVKWCGMDTVFRVLSVTECGRAVVMPLGIDNGTIRVEKKPGDFLRVGSFHRRTCPVSVWWWPFMKPTKPGYDFYPVHHFPVRLDGRDEPTGGNVKKAK